MIKDIKENEKNNFTDIGLKSSVLEHYFTAKTGNENHCIVKFQDGEMAYIRKSSKIKDDCDLLQNLLLKKFNVNAPQYLVVDDQGKRALLRQDLSNDNKSLVSSILNFQTKGNINYLDLIEKTVLAKDYHNLLNELYFVPDLYLEYDAETSLIKKFFIYKEIKKSFNNKPGLRPIDAFLDDKYTNFIMYFKKEVLKDIIKTRLIKMLTLDTNYGLRSNLYDLDTLSYVTKIIPFQSEANEREISDLKAKKDRDLVYQSEFSREPITLTNALEKVKNEKEINKVFNEKDRKEFVENLMNIDFSFKDESYKFDENYKDLCKTQRDKMANSLMELNN